MSDSLLDGRINLFNGLPSVAVVDTFMPMNQPLNLPSFQQFLIKSLTRTEIVIKSILLCCFWFCCLSGSAQVYKSDSWATTKSSGVGTIGIIYFEQAGLIEDVAGTRKGICVEIIKDFAAFVNSTYGKKVVIEYQGKEVDFVKFLTTVRTNANVLGVTNVTITEERKNVFKFTPPFIKNPVILITHRDAPTIKTFEDLVALKGYSANIIDGSTHVNLIKNFKKKYWPDLKVEYIKSGQEIGQRISKDPKIFTLSDLTEFIDTSRKKLPLKKQDLRFGEAEEFGFIMSKGSDWDLLWQEFLTPEYVKSIKFRKYVVDNLGAGFLGFLN